MIALVPDSLGTSLREHNDCHSPEDGKFCSGSGTRAARPGRRRGGPDYKIVFRSQTGAWWKTLGEDHKIRSARVALTFEPWAAAHLGAPARWKAPNGVTVAYLKGQRRSDGGTAVYHDFNVSMDELVVPMTRNVGAGRRALRAWAAAHIGNRVTARMQARQMVRPGD